MHIDSRLWTVTSIELGSSLQKATRISCLLTLGMRFHSRCVVSAFSMKNYLKLSNFALVLLAITFWWSFTIMERPRLGWFFYLAFFIAIAYGYLKWGKASNYHETDVFSSERLKWLPLGVVVFGGVLRLLWVRYSVVEQTSD